MTTAHYFEVAHWLAAHIERTHPSLRGRWWLWRALRRLKARVPDIVISWETMRRYQ